ncbi:YgaP family membrane protein [Bacillus sp. AL-1R]
MRPNISIINALIRITAGFTLLAYGTAKLTRRRCSNSVIILIIIGAMKVAEGVLRFCPMTALGKKCKVKADKHNEEDPFEDYIQPS